MPDLNLPVGGDATVKWTGATGTSATTGAGVYLNSATVTYALTTATGAAVSGGTGTLSYVAASNGNYVGVIESAVTSTLTPGAVYYLTLTLVQSPYNDERVYRCRANHRTS